VQCPICDLRKELDAARCACGYDYQTGDRSRAARRAEIVKARSTRKAWFGGICLATLPLSVLSAGDPPAAPAAGDVMFFAVPAQLIGGLLSLWRGLAWRSAASRRLLRATQPAELPAARLIE
jgi:hypothetical protein